MKKLRITVEGKVYDVTVEVIDAPGNVTVESGIQTAPASAGPAPLTQSTHSGSGHAVSAGEIPCPLAGKVISVSVTVGQQVAAGEQLLVVEAMKMNTYVHAPAAGKVVAIHVAAGDAVAEGQPLIKIE
jgi:glutaconyl-CoA/methylmalonyl-CoA decarboxylase subunit gamma